MHGIHQIKTNQPNKSAAVSQRKYNFSRHSDLIEEMLTGVEVASSQPAFNKPAKGRYHTTPGFSYVLTGPSWRKVPGGREFWTLVINMATPSRLIPTS